MEQVTDILRKLKRAKIHFQEKGMSMQDEQSQIFYKGKVSGLNLAISHLEKLETSNNSDWDKVIELMLEGVPQ